MTLEQANSIIDKMIAGEPDATRRELLAQFKDNCTIEDIRERFETAISDFVR